MNTQLIDSLAQIILSLSEQERDLLSQKIQPNQHKYPEIYSQMSEIENRLKIYETQYKMSSVEFYHKFRSGELGDDIEFFEWNVYYEMLLAAQKELSLLQR